MAEPILLQGAIAVGDVTLEENVSVWYNAVLRGDAEPIVIKKNSNIQDNVTIHTAEHYPVFVEENVSVGHGAILHGCHIGENTVVGMGAIVLNGAKVGKNCILGAGTLVTQNIEIPDNSLVIGFPGKVKRSVTGEEIRKNKENAEYYVMLSAKHKKEQV